jgi:hypothetical protein
MKFKIRLPSWNRQVVRIRLLIVAFSAFTVFFLFPGNAPGG